MVVTDLKDRVLSGRYRLLQSLGQGGMALVFEAHDQLLERRVAIKLLRKDYSGISGFRERFLQEARSAANLTHPNIVAVYDFGIDSGEAFIVMELADGQDLKTILQSGRVFSVSECLDLGVQICSGLGYAHRAGIVHCDVKPQNIILTQDKVAKITDFGIARAISTPTPTESSDVVWGSPHYMAPELVDGAIPTPQADVYSIGAVLYELLTGTPPFQGETVDEILEQQKATAPNSISALKPEVPQELEFVILKSLSKEPSSRYRTADQLGSLLSMLKNKLTAQLRNNPSVTPPPLPQSNPGTSLVYEDFHARKSTENTVDWPMVGLELLCLLMVGGLIPFWLFVIYSIRPLLH